MRIVSASVLPSLRSSTPRARVRTIQPAIQLRHTAAVRSLDWSPDGRLIATAAGPSAYIFEVDNPQSTERAALPHLDDVRCLRFSPDGARLATASADFGVRVWDVATGALAHLCKGHVAAAHTVIWSPDGDWLASASDDGSVQVFAADGGRAYAMRGFPRGVVALVSIPGPGWRVAASCGGGLVRVLDLDAGAALVDLDVPPGAPGRGRTVARPDRHGRALLLAAGGAARVVAIDGEPVSDLRSAPAGLRADAIAWEPGGAWIAAAVTGSPLVARLRLSGAPPRLLAGHRAPVVALAVLPDGALLTAGEDDRLLYWRDGVPVGSCSGHGGRAIRLAVAPDARRVAAVGHDHTVRIWPLDALGAPPVRPPGLTADGRATPICELPHAGACDVRVLPDGRLATGGHQRVKLWRGDLEEAALKVPVGLYLRLSPDAERLVYSHSANDAVLLDLVRPAVVRRLSGDDVRFARGGDVLVAPRRATASVDLLDGRTGALRHALPRCGRFQRVVELSPAGRWLVYGGEGDTGLGLVDLAHADAACVALGGHGNTLVRAAFSPDERRLATFGSRAAYVWRLGDDRPVAALDHGRAQWGHVGWCGADRLVTAFEGAVHLWTSDGRHVARLVATDERIHQLLPSPCGRYVFAGGAGGAAFIAHLESREVRTERLATNAGGAWAPSGDRLVCWERTTPWETRIFRLLDPEAGLVATLPGHARDLEGPASDSVMRVDFSADGARLVTVMWHDSRPRLWRTSDGELLGVLGPHGGEVRGVAFSHDQRLVYTAGGDHVRAWDVGDVAH